MQKGWKLMSRYNDAVSAGLRALELDARDAKACQATVASEHSMDVTIYAANMAGQVNVHDALLSCRHPHHADFSH